MADPGRQIAEAGGGGGGTDAFWADKLIGIIEEICVAIVQALTSDIGPNLHHPAQNESVTQS